MTSIPAMMQLRNILGLHPTGYLKHTKQYFHMEPIAKQSYERVFLIYKCTRIYFQCFDLRRRSPSGTIFPLLDMWRGELVVTHVTRSVSPRVCSSLMLLADVDGLHNPPHASASLTVYNMYTLESTKQLFLSA